MVRRCFLLPVLLALVGVVSSTALLVIGVAAFEAEAEVPLMRESLLDLFSLFKYAAGASTFPVAFSPPLLSRTLGTGVSSSGRVLVALIFESEVRNVRRRNPGSPRDCCCDILDIWSGAMMIVVVVVGIQLLSLLSPLNSQK